MKVVILCGGKGTRLGETTRLIPKPLVEIGGMPILWHIMKIFKQQGCNDFTLALGYKSLAIKDFFINQNKLTGDIFLSSENNKSKKIQNISDKWSVSMIETGLNTNTGGRLKRLKKYINGTFIFSYGDGLSNVNLKKLIEFHKKKKKLATITVVNPKPRFGVVKLEDGLVKKFEEKKKSSTDFINGGFMILEEKVLDFIEDDSTSFEFDTLRYLSSINELAGYFHDNFWECMDTKRDHEYLEELWDKNKAPWKTWE